MKQKKDVKFRHKLTVFFAGLLAKPVFTSKWNYKFKKCRELKARKPFLLIYNHSHEFDPIFLQMSFKKVLYHVCSDQVLRGSFKATLLRWAINPISKRKSVVDIECIKKMRKIIKEGGSVSVAPEGNMCYSGAISKYNDSVARLAKMLNVPLVIFRFVGLYFTKPRWAKERKKGKSFGSVSRIITPEELKELSVEQVHEIIKENFEKSFYEYQDDHKLKYKGKDLALGLERMIFMCPECKSFEVYSKDDKLICKKCNAVYQYTEEGYIIDKNNSISSSIVYERRTIQNLIDYLDNNGEFEFENDVLITSTYGTKNADYGKGTLNVKNDTFKLVMEKKTYEMPFHEVNAVSCQGRRKLIIYFDDDTLLVSFENLESTYKYLLIYEYYKLIYNNKSKKVVVEELGLA